LYFPAGVAVDASGNLFIVDVFNNRIRKVSTTGIITTVAGNGIYGYSGDGGPAASAQLNSPSGVAVDASGNLFIADTDNNRIREVSTTGIITTVAGGGTGGDGVAATSAVLYQPYGVAVDAAGNIFIASPGNLSIKKVSASSGIITTVAGNGSPGYSGDGGPATSASLSEPFRVAVDTAGNLFIADIGNQSIRKVSASSGIITTVAGNGSPGYSGDGGPATWAQLDGPYDVAVDAAGNLFIADAFNDRIRKVSTTGIITTVVGGGTGGLGDGGPAVSAELDAPRGVAVDAAGNLFIADTGNQRIRKVGAGVAPPGIQSLTLSSNSVAGGGTLTGSIGLSAAAPSGGLVVALSSSSSAASVPATVTVPAGVASAAFAVSAGNVSSNQVVAITASYNGGSAQAWLTVTPAPSHASGIITTVAGGGTGGDGGPATSAELGTPFGVAVDAFRNIFIAGPNRIRRVSNAGIITTVAGNGFEGYSGDGGPATSAKLFAPHGVAVDAFGNIFIADGGNHRIRKVSPAGIITTVAGNGSLDYSGDGGPATSAALAWPYSVAVDASGNIFIADSFNNRIRKVSPAGIITTVAGGGTGGDGGAATSAVLYMPYGVAIDAWGNLFIAETFGNRIRKVSPSGIITTVAGNGSFGGYSGDGGLATAAQLNMPYGVAVDASGNLFIADSFNDRIRKVSASSGIITTVAGNGSQGYSGDGGLATAAELSVPYGVAVDAAGNLFIADNNNRIREVGAPMN
jgi:sugar lactone lactonase YvrE